MTYAEETLMITDLKLSQRREHRETEAQKL